MWYQAADIELYVMQYVNYFGKFKLSKYSMDIDNLHTVNS